MLRKRNVHFLCDPFKTIKLLMGRYTHNFKLPSKQRWQCPIYNGTLETYPYKEGNVRFTTVPLKPLHTKIPMPDLQLYT